MTPFLLLFLSFSLPLSRKDKAPLCSPLYIAKERNLSAECIIRISSPSITIRFPSTQYDSSTHTKTNLLTQAYDEGKHSIYCRFQAGSPGSLKTPNSVMIFREMVLNTGWGRGWGVCDRLMDVFWLDDGEVIGSQYHQAAAFYDHVSTIQWTSSTR